MSWTWTGSWFTHQAQTLDLHFRGDRLHARLPQTALILPSPCEFLRCPRMAALDQARRTEKRPSWIEVYRVQKKDPTGKGFKRREESGIAPGTSEARIQSNRTSENRRMAIGKAGGV
jgi:hypothetical protein